MREVLVFGQLQDITGTDTLQVPDAADTASLRDRLFELHPGLRAASFAIAVDRQVVAGDTPIGENASIALLPPFSGG